MLTGFDHLEHLVDQGAVLGLLAHALESADGVVQPLLGHVPAGGLGHEPDADPQGDGGDRADDEHVAPGLAVTGDDGELVEEVVELGRAHGAALGGLQGGEGVVGVGARGDMTRRVGLDGDPGAALGRVDHGVHGEGEQLTGDDHELVDGHDRSADALGGGLGEVDGDGGAGAADGEAEDDAEGVHHPHGRGECGAQGADEEEERQHGDVVTAPVAVG